MPASVVAQAPRGSDIGSNGIVTGDAAVIISIRVSGIYIHLHLDRNAVSQCLSWRYQGEAQCNSGTATAAIVSV